MGEVTSCRPKGRASRVVTRRESERTIARSRASPSTHASPSTSRHRHSGWTNGASVQRSSRAAPGASKPSAAIAARASAAKRGVRIAIRFRRVDRDVDGPRRPRDLEAEGRRREVARRELRGLLNCGERVRAVRLDRPVVARFAAARDDARARDALRELRAREARGAERVKRAKREGGGVGVEARVVEEGARAGGRGRARRGRAASRSRCAPRRRGRGPNDANERGVERRRALRAGERHDVLGRARREHLQVHVALSSSTTIASAQPLRARAASTSADAASSGARAMRRGARATSS